MKRNRYIFTIACGLLGFVFFSIIGASTIEAWSEYRHMRACEENMQRSVSNTEELLKKETHYLDVLLSDPEFAQRVARKRLGYVAPGEWVFHFEEK